MIGHYPRVVELRHTIETHILKIRDSNNKQKQESEWPGKYIIKYVTPTKTKITSIPAVFVSGEKMVPSNWEIEGIECVIDDVPEVITEGYGSLISIETWPVRFTNYGYKEGVQMKVSLLDIQRRLAQTFPRDQTTYMPRTEATFEALTARIRGAVMTPTIP